MSGENSNFDYFMAIIAVIVVLFVMGFFASAPSHVQNYSIQHVVNREKAEERNSHGTCSKCKKLDVDLTDGLCLQCWWP